MTRITKEMAQAIANNAAKKSGVLALIDQEKADRFEWAERVRIFALGGDAAAARAEKTLAKIEALRKELPSGVDYGGRIRRTDDDIQINLAGVSVEATFDSKKTTPYKTTILADNELVQAFYDLEARREDLVARRETIKAQVVATVSKFTTVKKLVEAWPEVVELLPPQVETTKSNLPAIQVADLNKLVGLPSDQATA